MIRDKKTCFERFNSGIFNKKEYENKNLARLKKIIENGLKYDKKLLKEIFKRKELVWGHNTELRDKDLDIIKSFFVILQVGFFFRDSDYIAVFLRPSQEKTGSRKITTGFSIIKSWSPAKYGFNYFSEEIKNKIQILKGESFDYNFYATAYNDLFLKTKNSPKPCYFFPIYEINVKRKRIKPHIIGETGSKNPEEFIGWKKISDLFENKAYSKNEKTGEKIKIVLGGNVDKMLIDVLANNRFVSKTLDNGDGFLNRNAKLLNDGDIIFEEDKSIFNIKRLNEIYLIVLALTVEFPQIAEKVKEIIDFIILNSKLKI